MFECCLLHRCRCVFRWLSLLPMNLVTCLSLSIVAQCLWKAKVTWIHICLFARKTVRLGTERPSSAVTSHSACYVVVSFFLVEPSVADWGHVSVCSLSLIWLHVGLLTEACRGLYECWCRNRENYIWESLQSNLCSLTPNPDSQISQCSVLLCWQMKEHDVSLMSLSLLIVSNCLCQCCHFLSSNVYCGLVVAICLWLVSLLARFSPRLKWILRCCPTNKMHEHWSFVQSLLENYLLRRQKFYFSNSSILLGHH